MNILLTGFYGEGNLGDEAILSAILANLPAHITPIITSGKVQTNLTLNRRFMPIRRRGVFSWPVFLKHASKCEKSIFSGGILQDWSAEGVLFFASRIFASAALGCNPSLWGAGLGPLRSAAALSITTKALKYVDKAWLRDETSVNLFKKLSNKKVYRGTDWSWHFPTPTNLNQTNSIQENDYTAINLKPWKHNIEELEVLKKTDLSRKKILGLAARNEDVKAIAGLFPEAEIKIPENFTLFMEQCIKAKEGVAMRYHAALAMMRCGVDFKIIPYDCKVRELIDSLSRKDKFISENEYYFAKMKEAFLKEF